MINALTSALFGLSTASRQVAESAEKIAKAGTGEVDDVDLVEEAVKIKISETAYKANLITIRATDELSNELERIFDERV